MHDRFSSRRATFDAAAASYDAARPSYPPQLFDDLLTLTAVEPPTRFLEIGCGTGIATRALADRGYMITCVELGERLAERARELAAERPIEVITAAFEHWEPAPGTAFALVYAATAWHWLDPRTRFAKVHRLLQPRGHLAFWSAQHAFPNDVDPFFLEIQDVYEQLGQGRQQPWPPAPPHETPDETAEIEQTELFHDVRTKRYLWEVCYTADQYIALLESFSDHIAMAPDDRSFLYAEIRRRLAQREDGRVRRHWCCTLHVARRCD